MCLTTSQLEPYIAIEDIRVVKMLRRDSVLVTKYRRTPVHLDEYLYAEGKYELDKDCITQSLGEGLIHAFTNYSYATRYTSYNDVAVEAVITRGTKFFVSDDHETIAAEKMFISGLQASSNSGLTKEQVLELIGTHKMEPKPKKNDHDRLDPGHKIGLLILLFIFMLFVTRACAQTAQYDTAIVKYQNIERIVSQTSDKGAVRYYAVYNDKQENISELIPVSKTVLSYINACKQNQIEPSLAVRLKNGIIVGLIRYKTKYIVRKKR